MLVDFSYYTDIYNGFVLNEQTFSNAVYNAESYIRYLTCLNGDIFTDTAHADTVKCAVCAAADAYYMAVKESAEGGNVKSESKDGLSVSFIVSRKDGESVDDYARRCMYQAIRIRLLPTGWLSRNMRYAYDHKCECFVCL